MSDLISDPAPFVTFYSYKGGVGRSMAVLNVSALLAARGFRVLVIDFDLEAPGLSHLLVEAHEKQAAKRRRRKKNTTPCAGVVELLADAKARGKTSDLFAKPFPKVARRYTFDYPIPPELHAHEDSRLYIMPAGETDDTYSARLNDLDLAGLYQQGVGRGLMLHFKKALASSGLYDFIIVDSRTGHSDEAGICTRDLADHLMIVSGFNRQNIAGTASFLTNLRAAVASAGVKPNDPTIILSPVPIGEEHLLADREKEAKELFSAAWGRLLPLDLFIPYHPRLALTEDAYVTTRTASYLRDSYQEIEVRLLMAIDHLPGPLLAKAKSAINNGNGAQALASLERYAKLQASSSQSPSFFRRFPFGWQLDFDLEDDDPLLDKVLGLPEAESILRIYAETKSSASDLFQLGRKLHEREATLREVFDRMILQKQRTSPDALGNYANFLTGIRKDHDTAEAFYKRALEANPKHANNLGNYALFLITIGKDHDAAEMFFKRALEADSKNAAILRNYAIFLTTIRKNHDAAEAFYKRALEADPKNAHCLGSYALFLAGMRKDHDAAEAFFKRALEANPKHANILNNYARFLADIRKDHDAAEAFYKRALEADPKHANILGNYGQFLIGRGRLPEAISQLRESWRRLTNKNDGNTAEVAYSLWLGSALADCEESAWERAFKYLIAAGFKRPHWNFDAMLAQAKDKLKPESYRYAKALAEAFLDETKVAALGEIPRWRKLQPCDPDFVTSQGAVIESLL
ncbi:MAG: tetratricopeptide repeat protein [Akkermansiaceae bacterium]|nr:tetratricopeptide repeat protein [Akkermansiaceae bacterium]